MDYVNRLIDFIKSSPTAHHAVDSIKTKLLSLGFSEVYENEPASFSDGGAHFVIRNGSSIIAFKGRGGGFNIVASHSDSPSFKIKGEASGASYARLSTEKYGGMIHYSWLDRPLSVAGRIILRSENGIEARLVDLESPTLVIPSVAIHLNRGVNDSCKLNPAVDLLPLSGTSSAKGAIMKKIAETAGVREEDILSADLFVYNADCGRRVGINGEFILAPRIDDLGCVYASLEAFLAAEESDKCTSVLAVFDNEEVGSETKQGAASTFLDMTLSAIAGSPDNYSRMLYNSFMVSADNAHALHPNHPELYDSTNSALLGGGVVVKYNANQRYTTDAISDAILTMLAEREGLKLQRFSNRADTVGGSTLGSIANTRVSIPTVDIGLPQLAMHSAAETAACEDISDMIKLLTRLYSSAVERNSSKIIIK